MSNHEQLLKEAVAHLKKWVPSEMPFITAEKEKSIYASRNLEWERAMDFLGSIDKKMDEANAKEQQALMEVTDQQVIAMHDEYEKRFDNFLRPVSCAEFRKLANMLLCVSLVLEGDL